MDLKIKVLILIFCLTSSVQSQRRDDEEIAIKLDPQTANFVSSLLKNSAERAAANAPIIINRNSRLFKQYEQQRLPRRADPHNKISIFREDTDSITPKPFHFDGSTPYKASTPAPEVSNEIYHSYEVADQPVDSLEQQLTSFEVLKLPSPHHISKLPPIDSDLYVQPSDSLSHLNFDSSYSTLGQFVRPKGQFPNFPSSSTTEKYNYKTDFGYKVVPKPTEAGIPLASTLPYVATTTTTTTTTTTRPPTTTTPYIVVKAPTKPIVFVEKTKKYEPLSYPVTVENHPVSHEYEPVLKEVHHITQPVVHHTSPQVHHTKPLVQHEDQVYQPTFNYDVSQTHHAQPLVHHNKPQVHHTSPQVHHTSPQVHHTSPQVHHNNPQVHQDTSQIHQSQVHHDISQVNHEVSQVHHDISQVNHDISQVHHEVSQVNHDISQVSHDIQHQPFVHEQSNNFVSHHEQKPETFVYHEPANDQYQSPSNTEQYKYPGKHHKFAATTPHPLVFGFKPVASFVSSTLEGVFGPAKKPPNNSNRRPKPPPQFNFRQPKFFHRQPYQQGQSKPIRFPLGFFYT